MTDGGKKRPQVTRARAERLIQALAAEALSLNEEPRLWYSVEKLSVFGSYLSAKETLGDLDVGVCLLSLREPGQPDFEDQLESFATHFPPPSSVRQRLVDYLCWPELYIYKRLKRLGRGISIHSQDEVDFLGSAQIVIFNRNS